MNRFPTLIAVAAGGAVGALARFATIALLAPVSGRFFHAATLLINVVGSLALGLLYGAAQQKGAPLWLAGWLTGLLGVGDCCCGIGVSTNAALSQLAQRLVRTRNDPQCRALGD